MGFDDDVEQELAHLLRSCEWKRTFDAGSLQRGLRYAAEKRVRPDWKVERGPIGIMLSGRVRGTGRRAYRATVVILDPDDEQQPYGDCDCPVGDQCKHCAALIQTFLNAVEAERGAGSPSAVPANDRRVEQSWLRWLDELSTLHQGFASRVEPERRLGLLIDSEPGQPLPRLRVAAVWLRPSRSRAWTRLVDPRPIHWNGKRLDPAPAEDWDPVVEEPLTLLLAGARPEGFGSGPAWSVLNRPWHARALQTLLEAPGGPTAFLVKHTGPQLAPGPRRQLRMQWRSDPDGVQHLQAELEGELPLTDQCRLSMAGNELWYLDPEVGVMGPVEGSPALAVRAKQAPPIPEHKVAWAAEQMRRLAELPPGLEPPAAMQTVEVPRVAPGLVMRLGVIVLESRRPSMPDHEFGHASLAFDYAEARFPEDATDTDRVVRDGRVLSVPRDRKAEADLLDRLPAELVRLDALTERAGLPPPREEPGTRLLCLTEALPAAIDDWPQSLAAPEQWWPLISRLQAAGVRVEFESDFPEEPERVEPDTWHGEVEPAGNGWFDLGLDVEVEGERLDLLPLLRRALEDRDFPVEPDPEESEDATCDLQLEDGRILVLPLARLRPLIRTILDWVDDDPASDSIRLPVTAAAELETPSRDWRWRGRKHVQKLAKSLADLPAEIPGAPGFDGTLRDYQARGVAWMRRLAVLGLGGILADDMGLGKTVQVLAHIMDERARAKTRDPVLVVGTTSLVANWCAEAERFCPGLRVVHLQRPKAERRRVLGELAAADLIVTTYPLLVRDLEALQAQRFSLVVLDEAQAIKNPASQAARAVRALDAERRLAMTGTPLENHLGELWAQIDAVAPGFLGSAQWFGRQFRRPIEQHGEPEPLAQLRRRIAPLMLRRTRDEVLRELPEKTESIRHVSLTGAQRDLYETLRLAQHERVRQSIEKRGLAQSGIVMLDALLKLRQACCDPRLVKLDSARSVKRSAKLTELRSLLTTLLEEGRRVLIFSQFTEMLGLIAQDLERDGIEFETLTGQVPGRERKARIERFQQGRAPVFLISLKAGGVGLNLTAADTVIHYDPWWNPAVEAQATGRAHRIGQSRPVLVYRLVCAGTVEERIAELQARKSTLAESILSRDPAEAGGLVLDEAELDALFAPVGAG